MRKFGFALIALMLVVSLAACTRSASQAPVPTTTSNGLLPEGSGTPSTGGSAPTEDPMILLQQFATQTALAASGGQLATATPSTNAAGETNTPQIISTTNTPAPGIPTLTPGPTQALPTQGPRPTSYTLQQGEFPFCISRRFNLNPDELLSLNGLVDSQILQPGLVLKIPQTGNPFPYTQRYLIAHPATYTVVLNDTIYGIACKYGDVDPMAIAANNGLAAPYTLKVGQTLNIP